MRSARRVLATLFAVLLVGCASVGVASAGAAVPVGSCDLYASPTGSDQNPGTQASPLATLTALDQALTPGQTGCLLGGSYGAVHAWHNLSASGTPTGQITITAAPGQTVRVTGWIDLSGSYTTLQNLIIDGSNDYLTQRPAGIDCGTPVSQPLDIEGNHDIFQDNDYSQSVASLRSNGIGIGFAGTGHGDATIIRDNRIHDVGQCHAFDHLIYLSHGDGVQIYDNWMWNDPHGWGVQLYPGPTNAHVYANVIDHAGSGFVIGGSATVANNTIDHNIVINSTGLPTAGLTQGVGISTCCTLGTNNTFADNTIYNTAGGITNAPINGLSLTNNTTTNPNLADPTNHDYRTLSLPTYNLWTGDLTTPLTAVQATVGSDSAQPASSGSTSATAASLAPVAGPGVTPSTGSAAGTSKAASTSQTSAPAAASTPSTVKPGQLSGAAGSHGQPRRQHLASATRVTARIASLAPTKRHRHRRRKIHRHHTPS